MADNKVNSGLLEFSEDQKVFVALDAETSEVKKAVTIDGDGVETDMLGVQPTGKKEITSTAEVNVASYATAQVVDEDLVAGNIKKDVDILGVVGSYEPAAPASDFSTATVAVINQAVGLDCHFLAPVVDTESDPALLVVGGLAEAAKTTNFVVAMYNNTAFLNISPDFNASATTGSIETVIANEVYYIKGDCSITIVAANN